MVKCGHCHEHHDSIDAVMICASNHGFRSAPRQPVTVAAVQEELRPVGWDRPMRPVKPSEERREETRSNLISDVNRLGQQVPVGRYAIRNQSGPNDLAFYHVERPDNGRWAGKTFVKQQLGPNVERINMGQQRAALLRIAADPQGAFQLYGQMLGICGVCGRQLTNEISRKFGIGPDCRKNMGY